MTNVDPTKPQTVVNVEPAAKSKTIWAQIIGLAISLLTVFGINVDPATATAIVTGVQAVIAVLTVILRTFFTKSVTPTVANK